MSIIRDGEYVKKEIFDGRDSEWFDNLCGKGWDNVYDILPVEDGLPDLCPEQIREDKMENGYFCFRWIPVVDMIKWLEDKKPWIDAGWATTYEKWNYETRGIIDKDGLPHFKPNDNNEPYYFIQYEKRYDCSKWLFDYLTKEYPQGSEGNDILIYYFDY